MFVFRCFPIVFAAAIISLTPQMAMISASEVMSSGEEKKGYRPDNMESSMTPMDQTSTAEVSSFTRSKISGAL